MSNVIQLFQKEHQPIQDLVGLIVQWAQENDIQTTDAFRYLVAGFGTGMRSVI